MADRQLHPIWHGITTWSPVQARACTVHRLVSASGLAPCPPRQESGHALNMLYPGVLGSVLLQLKDMQKEVLRYKRSDGVDLTGGLCAPTPQQHCFGKNVEAQSERRRHGPHTFGRPFCLWAGSQSLRRTCTWCSRKQWCGVFCCVCLCVAQARCTSLRATLLRRMGHCLRYCGPT